MRTFIPCSVLAAILLMPAAAFTADWKQFAEDSEGIPVYYDAAGIEHDETSPIYRIWTKIVSKEGLLPIRDYEYYDEAVHLIDIDCELKAYRITKGQILDERGKVVATYLNEPGAPWEPIEPGTIGETLSAIICPKEQKK